MGLLSELRDGFPNFLNYGMSFSNPRGYYRFVIFPTGNNKDDRDEKNRSNSKASQNRKNNYLVWTRVQNRKKKDGAIQKIQTLGGSVHF